MSWKKGHGVYEIWGVELGSFSEDTEPHEEEENANFPTYWNKKYRTNSKHDSLRNYPSKVNEKEALVQTESM